MHKICGENGGIARMAKTKDPFQGSDEFEAKETRMDFVLDGRHFTVEKHFDEEGDRECDPIVYGGKGLMREK
jgi:hypothetical protein